MHKELWVFHPSKGYTQTFLCIICANYVLYRIDSILKFGNGLLATPDDEGKEDRRGELKREERREVERSGE